MVWGKRSQDKYKWHAAFAWRPLRLMDGRWVWLQQIERISYFAAEIPTYAPFTAFSSWVHRLPARRQ